MDVVILGRIGYDLRSEEPHVALSQARRFSRYLGGFSAYMAVGPSRLDTRVGMISCLGDDHLSRVVTTRTPEQLSHGVRLDVGAGGREDHHSASGQPRLC